ncbi:MAG: nucleotidyltransferase domain-containing protein [bacterium]
MRIAEIEATNRIVLAHLRATLGSQLIYLGYFGSVAKGNQTLWSDIDYLIIATGLPSDPLARDRLSRKAKQLLRGVYPLLAFNFYTPLEISQLQKDRPWFELSIIDESVDIYGSLSFLPKTKKQRARRQLLSPRYRALVVKHPPTPPRQRREEIDFLLHRSSQALTASRYLLQSKSVAKTEVVATLYRSLSSLLKALLIKQGIYPVKGEVVQLFTNCYASRLSSGLTKQLLSLGLAIEQMAGRCDGLLLDFSEDGRKILDLEFYLKPRDLKQTVAAYQRLQRQLLKLI